MSNGLTEPTRRSPEFLRIEGRILLRLRHTAASIVEIGCDLIEAKRLLPHGAFLPWVEEKLEMSPDSARRFMNVAEKFGDQIPQLAAFAPSVLYLLAAPSTPETVRDAVIAEAAEGRKITHDHVQEMVKSIQTAAIKRSAAAPARVTAKRPPEAPPPRPTPASSVTTFPSKASPAPSRTAPDDAEDGGDEDFVEPEPIATRPPVDRKTGVIIADIEPVIAALNAAGKSDDPVDKAMLLVWASLIETACDRWRHGA